MLSSACLFSYYEMIVTKSRRLQVLFHASPDTAGLQPPIWPAAGGIVSGRNVLAANGRDLATGPDRYGAALSRQSLSPLVRGGSASYPAEISGLPSPPHRCHSQLLAVFTPVGIALLAYAGRRLAPYFPWSRARFAADSGPDAICPDARGSILISFNTPIITERNLIGLFRHLHAYGLVLQRVIAYKPPVTATALLSLLLLQLRLGLLPVSVSSSRIFVPFAQHSVAADSKVVTGAGQG